MTTVDSPKPAHLTLGGGTGSAFEDDASSESQGSSIPEVITLTVVLPDGSVKTVDVNSGKPMLDLTVQLAAANHLSPTDYTLALYNPQNGRPIEYKASQMIGTLHVNSVHLVEKKANKVKARSPTTVPSPTSNPPFEITNRLAVNLPKNQKMVLRIKPESTLADIFKMVCNERNLDPYKHELRHPTQPNMALNMANTLAGYKVNEITVVSISEPGHDVITPTSPKAQSIYDTHWTYTNSMPRKKADTQPAPPSGQQEQPSYMPGMNEKKKKKGFLSLFSRKKGGKFNLAEASYDTPVSVTPPPAYEPPVISNGNKRESSIYSESSPQVRTSMAEARVSTTQPDGAKVTVPKPSRKKRAAPAPPVNRPLSVDTSNAVQDGVAHSRGSSHSSGFDEVNVSPLGSLESSSGKAPPSGQNKAVAVSGTAVDGQSVTVSSVTAEENGLVYSSAASTVSRNSSLSAGGDSLLYSLPRNRKKRKAPPPPQSATKPSPSTSSPEQNSGGGSLASESSPSQSPDHGIDMGRTSTQADDDHAYDTREIQMAIAEELKKGDSENQPASGSPRQSPDGSTDSAGPASRPCHFIPPPPPNTPPPPESPGFHPTYPGLLQRSKVGVMVADSATQVHVTLRDSLSSEVSCDGHTSDVMPESPTTGVSDRVDISQEETPILLERQISDVAVFVEQMTELTESVAHGDLQPSPVTQNVSEQHETSRLATSHGNTDQNEQTLVTERENSELHSSSVQDTALIRGGIQKDTHMEEFTLDGDGKVTNGMEMSAEEMNYITSDGVTVQEIHTATVETGVAVDSEEPSINDNQTEFIMANAATGETDFTISVSGSTSRETGFTSLPENLVNEMDIANPGDDASKGTDGAVLAETATTATAVSQSDDSTEGSLSHLNIDEVLSDSEPGDDVLPDSTEPVQLVKKKLIPEFSLNLEEDGGEAKDETDDEEYTEVITGEITTMIKVEDYQAALAASNGVQSGLSFQNDEQQEVDLPKYEPKTLDLHDTHHMTLIQMNPEEHQDRSWRQHTSDECLGELSFDNADVTYVSPVASYSEQAKEAVDVMGQVSDRSTAAEQFSTNYLESCYEETLPNAPDVKHEGDVIPHGEEFTVVDDVDMVPSSGMSLLSIVSEVKSKPDVKQHHASSDEIAQQPLTDTSEKASEDTAKPATLQTEEPVFKSLRDVYKSKVEKETEVIIIPKQEPFHVPVPDVKKKVATSKQCTSATIAALQDSKAPSGEIRSRPTDFHIQPLVYKKESLAVSRKAPRMQNAELEEKSSSKQGGQCFWGPRPWSARETSHEVPSVDVNKVLMMSREAVIRSRQLPTTMDNTNVSERVQSVSKEDDSITIGLYSPGKTSSSSPSPKDRCSDISFSPRNEEEETQAEMEEKSITMLAYPVERKSVSKRSLERDVMTSSRPYSSSLALDHGAGGTEREKIELDTRKYNSVLGLSNMDRGEGVTVEPSTGKPITRSACQATDGIADSKEKAKITLQEQYADVQQQFTNWQKQLMASPRLQPSGESEPLATSAVGHEDGSMAAGGVSEEQKQFRLKAEQNYRWLSTPRPFTHRSTEPQAFKPAQFMKKENTSVIGDGTPGVFESQMMVQRSSSVDSAPEDRPPSPTVVQHRKLVASSSEGFHRGPQTTSSPPPPPALSKTRPRFEPKLDPREELMIAIRNAGGIKMLNKVNDHSYK